MGFSFVVSRFGTILAPYILLMGQFSPVVFGCAALTAGISALILPETSGIKLPETLQDGEQLKVAKMPGCGRRREVA